MKYPEVLPGLKLCKNEDTRRQLSLAYGSRCIAENSPILEDLVAKRHEVPIFSDTKATLSTFLKSEWPNRQSMSKTLNKV